MSRQAGITRRGLLTFAAAPAAASARVDLEISALHPRIFVRNDAARVGKALTVTGLRRRLRDPAYARWRRPLVGQGAAAIVERAARYLEDGDPAELESVRHFLATRTFSFEKNDVGGFLAGAEMATAFDWVYGGLSESARAAAMANIVATADSSWKFLHRGGPDINHNYTYMALNTVAVCGLVLKGEPEPYGPRGLEYLALAREFLESPGKVLETWDAREGAWAEGSHYTFHETLRTLVMTLASFRTASSLDYFRLAETRYRNFTASAGRFLIACTRPDMTFERLGDCSPNRVTANLTVPVTVEMLAWGLGRAQDAGRLRSFSSALLEAYGEEAVHPSFGWGMRIFHDPRASQAPSFRTLPVSMRLGAGATEHIVFRNGWSEASTQITILAGDHFTDHQHFDKGHFLVYHRGGLAVDGGAYDSMYKPGGHWNEYAIRTLAHNCLLVYDPDEALPKGHGNDGGQRVLRGLQHHRDWDSYVAHRRKEGLDTADVLNHDYDETAGYHYLRIDLQRAYGGKVAAYERQFLYLPAPDFLVVFDRVSAAAEGFAKRWLLHFEDPPEVDGITPGPGITSFPGARLTTLRRRGRLDLGGRSFTYDGTLFVRTLLPAPSHTAVIGGPGYEYFNAFAGVNYPPSRPAVAAPLREPGRWRIEVAPSRPARDDQFLHVLQMAGPSAQPVEARLVAGSTNKLAGVHLLTPGQDHVVLFTGGAGGLEWEISSTQPAICLLAELPPLKRLEISINGRKFSRQVNPQGILFFTDRERTSRRISISATL